MSETLPLLLLPGLLCDAALWLPQIEAMADIAAPIVADLTLDDSIAAMAKRALGSAPERFAMAGLSMGGYVAQEIMRQVPSRVSRLALLDTSARSDTPELHERRLALIKRRDGFLRQQTAIMNRPDSRADLARIHVHTLVLCGADDALTPVEVHREMATGIADSRLVVVPDCGHLSTLEAPDRVNAELRRWLTEEL